MQIKPDELKPGHEFLAGITREALEREHSIALNVPRSNGAYLPFANGFATPSGKAELYSEALAAAGLDPVAAYIAPTESRHGEQAGQYPLELLSRKHDNFLNTTFCNLAGHQKMERRFELQMNTVDASARGITDGDALRVHNDRGEAAFARPGGRQRASRRGLGLPGLGALGPGRQEYQRLTSDRLTDMGRGATFYSALVEVEKAFRAPPAAHPHEPNKGLPGRGPSLRSG